MRLIYSLLIMFLSFAIADPANGADRTANAGSALELPLPAPEFTAAAETRYWIVSSRNCPQKLQRIGCCELEAWRVDRCSCAAETCQPITLETSAPSPAGADEIRGALVPGIPVCVMVHGSYARWDNVLIESRHTWNWLRNAAPGRPVQLIAYTWPSEPVTYLPNLDANFLGKRSGINGFYLARLLQMIPPECPVCLIGHSHGTRTISSMLHLLQGGIVDGYCLPAGSDPGHRIRVVFAASAIDHDWLNPGQRYEQALGRLDRLLNLRNRRDWALGLYPFRTIGSSRALGRAGWTSRDYVRLGTQSAQMQELDVTCLIGKPHIWPAYYQSPELADAITPFIQFADVADSDESRSNIPAISQTADRQR